MYVGLIQMAPPTNNKFMPSFLKTLTVTYMHRAYYLKFIFQISGSSIAVEVKLCQLGKLLILVILRKIIIINNTQFRLKFSDE